MNDQTRSKIVSALRAAATQLSASDVRAANIFDKKPQRFSIESIEPGRNEGEFRVEVRLAGSGFATVRMYPTRNIYTNEMTDWRFTSTSPLSPKEEAALSKAVAKFRKNSKVKPTSASSKASDFGFSDSEVFYPLAKAKKLAEEARKSDPDWTYEVTPPEGNQRGLARVVVFDEDGEEIGSL